MTKEEAILNIESAFKQFASLDDRLVSQLEDLKIASFNFRIIDAHIGDNTGITPITDYLNRTINNMEEEIKGLRTNRQLLTDSLMTIRKE